jgi:hypothetical protein
MLWCVEREMHKHRNLEDARLVSRETLAAPARTTIASGNTQSEAHLWLCACTAQLYGHHLVRLL